MLWSTRSLEDFDFHFNPEIPKAKIIEEIEELEDASSETREEEADCLARFGQRLRDMAADRVRVRPEFATLSLRGAAGTVDSLAAVLGQRRAAGSAVG